MGNEVTIREGLSPGTVLVTAGIHVLRPGLKVNPVLEKAPN